VGFSWEGRSLQSPDDGGVENAFCKTYLSLSIETLKIRCANKPGAATQRSCRLSGNAAITYFSRVQWSCFASLKVAGFEPLNFDCSWLVLTDR
jgi:hypothetical protein